jgi:hypothetical protein
MLSRESEQFSEIFYVRHRQHIIRLLTGTAIWLAVIGLTGVLLLRSYCRGGSDGDGWLASFAIAIFLYSVWWACGVVPDQFRSSFVARRGEEAAEVDRRRMGCCASRGDRPVQPNVSQERNLE